jgi:ribosomal protein L17
MAGIRINKKHRRKYRQKARDHIARAEVIPGTETERAAQLRRVADALSRLGKPPKSKARRGKKMPGPRDPITG